MTLADIEMLLDFHYWARDRVLDAAAQLTPEQYTRDLNSSFKSVRDTLVHTYGAEWAWYQRWEGTSPSALPPAADYPDVATLRSAWTAQEQKVRRYIGAAGEQGIQAVIEYKTLAGAPGASPVWQMAQHVVNHGSYHRGQLTTMIRQLGATPPKSTDLIAYYRDRTVTR